MSRRAAIAFALLASLGAGAQAADAATVSTPERCYSSREPVDYVGTEFRAGTKFTVFLAGRQVDTGRVSRFGDLAGDFKAPVPDSRPAGERTFTLTVTDGQRRATTRFRSTKFGADYRPDRGDPATLRVRFYAFDFGARRTVFGARQTVSATQRTAICAQWPTLLAHEPTVLAAYCIGARVKG